MQKWTAKNEIYAKNWVRSTWTAKSQLWQKSQRSNSRKSTINCQSKSTEDDVSRGRPMQQMTSAELGLMWQMTSISDVNG